MLAAGNNSAILVADGYFYLGGTLELAQTVLLQGNGMNEPTTGGARSAPGTWLVFPPEVTGIRIYSSDTHDHPSGGADRTRLRDLTIWCRERGVTGHGVHATVVFAAENLNVQNFAVDGFHVTGHLAGDLDGNADGTYLSTCVAGGCGRDGFHFEGGDANTSLIQCCSSVVNMRYGFFDRTMMNTYVGCHAEGNLGSEYHTEGAEPCEAGFNSTTFIGCLRRGKPQPQHAGGAAQRPRRQPRRPRDRSGQHLLRHDGRYRYAAAVRVHQHPRRGPDLGHAGQPERAIDGRADLVHLRPACRRRTARPG